MQLPVNQHRIDHFAAIIDGNVAHDLRLTGLFVDFHHADVRAEWKGKILGLEKVSSR